MRSCVIFNPAAKGEKAKRFRRHLDDFAGEVDLKLTTGVGDARRLGAAAVAEGFETVIAAGGDGTINEVLNGIGDAPEGFNRTRLGVLPLGTVNVFARELAIPTRLKKAWAVLRRGRETLIDLPCVEYRVDGKTSRRYFAQLAGAGLDARAIELVHWETKKKLGPMAYVLAGLKALRDTPAVINVATEKQSATGALVLVGNGRLYGGDFRVFPEANLQDGLLDICVFPKTNWLTLAQCGTQLLLNGTLPSAVTQNIRSETLTLSSPSQASFELDGELVGHLPATFTVQRSRLRVVVP